MNTLEQLQAMPDEQIVELCATEVMGWHKGRAPVRAIQTPDSDRENPRFWYGSDGGQHSPCVTDVFMNLCRWSPLTDWNHTMEVVERMRMNGLEWHIFSPIATASKVDVLNNKRKDQWFVSCGLSDGTADTPFEYHRDPQRAICLAALLAVSPSL